MKVEMKRTKNFFDFLNFSKIDRYFVVFFRNFLTTDFNCVLSTIILKKISIKLKKFDRVCISLNSIDNDRKVVLFIKMRIFCNFEEKSYNNSC